MSLSVPERRYRMAEALGTKDQVIIVHEYQHGKVFTIATKKHEENIIRHYIQCALNKDDRYEHCAKNVMDLVYDGGVTITAAATAETTAAAVGTP